MYPYWIWNGELDSETCDKIIAESLTFEENKAKIGTEAGAANPDLRLSRIRWVQSSEFISSLVTKYFSFANRNFGFDASSIFDVQFTEYRGSEKGHYDWHIDSFENPTGFDRKLSMVIQLTDPAEYEGGSFCFYDRVMKEFQERGSILVFPSFQAHRVEPVTSGTRRSLVSWIEGPRWR